jgi:hypothetical protein
LWHSIGDDALVQGNGAVPSLVQEGLHFEEVDFDEGGREHLNEGGNDEDEAELQELQRIEAELQDIKESAENQCRKARDTPSPVEPEEVDDQADPMEGEFHVEKIVGKKVEGGKVLYHVKWQGFGVDENTWEPVANFLDKDVISQYELETSTNGDGGGRLACPHTHCSKSYSSVSSLNHHIRQKHGDVGVDKQLFADDSGMPPPKQKTPSKVNFVGLVARLEEAMEEIIQNHSDAAEHEELDGGKRPMNISALMSLMDRIDSCVDPCHAHLAHLEDSVNAAAVGADGSFRIGDASPALTTATRNKAKALEQIPLETSKRLLEILGEEISVACDTLGVLENQAQEEDDIAEDEGERPSLKVPKLVDPAECLLCANAAVAAMWIAATPGGNPLLIQEEIVENGVALFKALMKHVIVPVVDPLNKTSRTPNSKGIKRTNSSSKSTVNRSGVVIGTRLGSLLKHFECLLSTVNVSDKIVLETVTSALDVLWSTDGSIPLAQELQLHSIDLLKTVFAQYPQHREYILNTEIFAMLTKLPTSKKTLRCYTLNEAKAVVRGATKESKLARSKSVSTDRAVCMFSALAVHLIQSCVGVNLLQGSYTTDDTKTSFKQAQTYATTFMAAFLKRCEKREDGSEYRRLFSNFVDDLLTVYGSAEWPAAEVVLHAMCNKLVGVLQIVVNESAKRQTTFESSYALMVSEVVGRVCCALASERYLNRSGGITLHNGSLHKRDANPLSKPGDEGENQDCICGKKLQGNQLFVDCDECHRWYHPKCLGMEEEDIPNEDDVWMCDDCLMIRQVNALQDNSGALVNEEDIFKQFFLNFLTQQAQGDAMFDSARQFYLSWWIHSPCGEALEKEFQSQLYRRPSAFQLEDFPVFSPDTNVKVARRLAANRYFAQSLKGLLITILTLLRQGPPSFRSNVLKSLLHVIRADPAVMSDKMTVSSVRISCRDAAISVRHAAVSLVGEYIQSQPKSMEEYIDQVMISLGDSGVSVRKACVTILRSVLIQQPLYHRRTDIYKQLVKLLSDALEEESIKELVFDTLDILWFSSNARIESKFSSISLEPNDRTESDDFVPFTPNGGRAGTGVVNAETPNDLDASLISESDSTSFHINNMRQGGKSDISKMNENERNRVQVEQMIDVVSHMLRDKEHEWLKFVLDRLFYGPADGDKIKKTKKKEDKLLREKIARLVGTFFDKILSLDDTITESGGGDAAELATAVKQLMSCVCIVKVIAQVAPELLVSHVYKLLPYLKPLDLLDGARKKMMLQSVVSTFEKVLPVWQKPQPNVSQLQEIVTDLHTLILNAPLDLVPGSCRCLSVVYTMDKGLSDPKVICNLFKAFALEAIAWYPVSSKPKSPAKKTAQYLAMAAKREGNIPRCMLAMGAIYCAFDLDTVKVRTLLLLLQFKGVREGSVRGGGENVVIDVGLFRVSGILRCLCCRFHHCICLLGSVDIRLVARMLVSCDYSNTLAF